MKKYIVIVFIILSVFLLTGCDKLNKSSAIVRPHSEEEINKFLKDKNLKVIKINESDENNYSALVTDDNGKVVNFYTFNEEKDAISFYKYYFDVYKAMKSDGDTETVTDDVSYELTTSSNYYYIRRDGKAIVVVKCTLEEKDDYVKIIKELNY